MLTKLYNEITNNSDSKSLSAQSLNTKDVCQEFFAGCSNVTLWRLRKKDSTFPKPFSLGGHPLWRRADVQAWYDAKVAEQSEVAA